MAMFSIGSAPDKTASPAKTFVSALEETVRIIEMPVDRIVEKTVTVEVPVERVVEKIVEIQVPVEVVREIVVEKIVKVVDETRLKELERQIKTLKEEVQYNAFAVVDARQELLEVKNRPTNVERLEKSLNKFKNVMALITAIQMIIGLSYLLVKGM